MVLVLFLFLTNTFSFCSSTFFLFRKSIFWSSTSSLTSLCPQVLCDFAALFCGRTSAPPWGCVSGLLWCFLNVRGGQAALKQHNLPSKLLLLATFPSHQQCHRSLPLTFNPWIFITVTDPWPVITAWWVITAFVTWGEGTPSFLRENGFAWHSFQQEGWIGPIFCVSTNSFFSPCAAWTKLCLTVLPFNQIHRRAIQLLTFPDLMLFINWSFYHEKLWLKKQNMTFRKITG